MEDEDSVPLVPKTRDKSQHLHKVQCPGLSGPRIHSHPAGAHTGDANTEGTRADLLYSCSNRRALRRIHHGSSTTGFAAAVVASFFTFELAVWQRIAFGGRGVGGVVRIRCRLRNRPSSKSQ